MGRVVLIVGQIPDPHIERVASLLEDFGAAPVVFDCFKHDHLLELRVHDGGAAGSVCIGGQRWPFEAIESVWWRWKPLSAAEWTGAFARVAEEFASREWRATLRSLPAFLPRALWVNPLAEHFQATYKPWQLALGRELGLRLPDTVFTNDPEAVLAQFSRRARLVYKTVSSFLVPPDEIIFTNEISEADVRESFPNIRRAPGTFQHLVEKSHELRVTIVGREVFAVRINSQQSCETSLDWRRDQFQDMYAVVNLTEELTHQLLAFQSRAGLLFGAYDLIVPKGGQPVFLECNPGGQWLWLELKLGLPISESVARLLAGREHA